MMKHKNPHWPELSLLLKTLPSKPGVYRFWMSREGLSISGKLKISKTGQLLLYQGTQYRQVKGAGYPNCRYQNNYRGQ